MTEFRKINETPKDLFAHRSAKPTQNAKPTPKRTRAHVGSLKSKSLPSKNSIHYELNRHSKSVASLVKLHLHVDRPRRSHRRPSSEQSIPKKPPRYPPRTSTENSRRKNVHRDKMPLPEPRKRTRITSRAPQNGGVIENENIYEIIDGIKSCSFILYVINHSKDFSCSQNIRHSNFSGLLLNLTPPLSPNGTIFIPLY